MYQSRVILFTLSLLPFSLFSQTAQDKAFAELDQATNNGACQAKLDKQTETMTKAVAALQRMDSKINELNDALASRDSTIEQLKASAVQVSDTELQALKQQAQSASTCLDTQQSSAQEVAINKQALEKSQAELSALTTKYQQLNADKQALEAKLNVLSVEQQAQSSSSTNSALALAQANAELTKLQAKYQQLNADNIALKQQLTANTANTASKNNNSANLEALKKALEASQQELADKKIQLLAALQNNTQQSANTSTTAIQAEQAKTVLLSTQNQQLQQQLEVLQTQLLVAAKPADCPVVQNVGANACIILDNVDLERVNIKSAGQTTNQGWSGDGHTAYNVMDGKPESFWASQEYKLSGQSIRLNLHEKRLVSRLHISIPEYGWQQPSSFINLLFSNGSSQKLLLEDKYGWHRFAIQPVNTDYVEIEFGEMYKSRDIKNKHVGVAEVELFATPIAKNK